VDRINELSKQIADAMAELKSDYGVYGMYDTTFVQGEIGFHMSSADFKKHFPQHLGCGRDSKDFPVELYVMVNGVKFFALEKRDLGEAV